MTSQLILAAILSAVGVALIVIAHKQSTIIKSGKSALVISGREGRMWIY